MQGKPFGVIEGFYGDPWTWQERAECIDALARWGGNTYVWAPKSEPRHRDAWTDPFTDGEIEGFAMLAARAPEVRVSVGLTPGDGATVGQVMEKLGPALAAGCSIVTLCFDDLPVLDAAGRHRDLANGVRAATGSDVWLVPTHYAGTTGSPYLAHLVEGLGDGVQVMWTGTHVVNDSITATEIAGRARAAGGRAPMVWDNVPVNDAMMTSYLHMGPLAGRDRGLVDECSGYLLNPMVSMRASLPTIRSGCAWWNGRDAHAEWREEASNLGMHLLAQATSYPGDPHWPGDMPGAGWFEEVATMPDTGDADIDPWIDSARRGARICLDALAVVEALGGGAAASDAVRHALGLLQVREWLRLPARTLGAGPRTRPFFTQDHAGRFTPTDRIVETTVSLPEMLVDEALAALSRNGGAE